MSDPLRLEHGLQEAAMVDELTRLVNYFSDYRGDWNQTNARPERVITPTSTPELTGSKRGGYRVGARQYPLLHLM